jgi:hypothetical protein
LGWHKDFYGRRHASQTITGLQLAARRVCVRLAALLRGLQASLITYRARLAAPVDAVPQVQPVSPDVDAALHAWRDKTPALAAIKGAAAGAADKGAAAAGKKKGGKDDPKAAKGKKK